MNFSNVINSENCRLCDKLGTYDIFANNFLCSNQEEILLLTAFKRFSTITEDSIKNYFNLPKFLCDQCTEDLITSYEMLLKIIKFDDLYLNADDIVIMQHSDDDVVEELNHATDVDNNNIQLNNDNFENTPNNDDYVEFINNDIICENIDEEQNLTSDNITNATTIINNDESNIIMTDEYYEEENINLVNTGNDVYIDNNDYNDNDICGERDCKQDIVINDGNNEIFNDNISVVEVEEEPPKPRRKYKRKLFKIINNKSHCIKPNCFVGLPKYTLTPYSKNNKQNITKYNSTAEAPPQMNSEETVSEVVISKTETLKKSSSKCIKQIDVTAERLLGGHLNFNYDVPDKESDTSMYLCKYCPKAFSSPYHLIFHTRKSHVCQYCLQGFTKAQDLHKHVKEHNRFECSFCNKIFVTNSNLRAHCKKIHNVIIPAHVAFIPMQEQPEQSS